jgi:Fur family ferric uptake transcriptional regulator
MFQDMAITDLVRMNERVSKLEQSLRDGGHRLTSSRLVILEALVESGGHLSADELASTVRSKVDSVSRMTIYRTLDLLCDLGHVRPVYQGARAARFILLEDGRHHHFVCSGCDRVYEFDDCFLEELLDRLQSTAGFDVQAHLLELYGLCDNCQA